MNDSMQTVYAPGGGDGSQQREVADGANVVFTDTGGTELKHPDDGAWVLTESAAK